MNNFIYTIRTKLLHFTLIYYAEFWNVCLKIAAEKKQLIPTFLLRRVL